MTMKYVFLFVVALCSALIYSSAQMTSGAASTPRQTSEVAHPLDPLSADEMRQVVRILRTEKAVAAGDIFNIINLKEPSKQEVLSYVPGSPFGREAFASWYNFSKNGMMEAVVDLRAGKVLGLTPVPNVIGMGLAADSQVVEDIVRKDPAWAEALKKRGLTLDSVAHRSIFPGDLGIAPIGHREQLVMARLKGSQLDIEGLLAYADLTTGRILKIVDEPNRFGARVNLNYFNEDSVVVNKKGPAPIVITQPEGSSVVIKGHEIQWQNWRLRYGVDNREGLVIYNVSFDDNGQQRPVMYRGSMPEMVVPYGAPSLLQAAYNFFDAGEYRLGQGIARPMSPGADAPENAVYAPAVLHRENGEPYQLDKAVAIFEEYGGTLWRHGTVSRRATNLAIKYYTQIENYDYGFTWRFRQDGTIDVDIELTGIVEVQGVHRVNAKDAPHPDDLTYNGMTYGTLVHPHVEAINHQHFFVFRLDMDIDGQRNSVMEMNGKLVPPGDQNPYSNAFVMEHTHFMHEKEAQRDVNYQTARCWHIVNGAHVNALGQEVGYMLMPGGQAQPFMPQGSIVRKKAGFLDHQVWVTPYNAGEEYPAGKYPASNKVYDGLPQWTAQNRMIDNTDLVLWYVAGITHIVRPEEWPVMPVHHMGFTLMPFGFFSENPTLGLEGVNGRIGSAR